MWTEYELPNGVVYVTCEALVYGDYCGAGSVGLSNIRVLTEVSEEMDPEFTNDDGEPVTVGDCPDTRWDRHKRLAPEDCPTDDVLHGYGGWSSQWVWLRSDTMADTIAALDSYPLIDESHHSETEMEQQGEAWESWAESSLRRALVKRIPEDSDIDPDDFDDWLGDDSAALYDLFREGCEAANVYWEDQQGGPWIDLERVSEAVDLAALIRAFRNR